MQRKTQVEKQVSDTVLIGTNHAARLLGVSDDTVRRYADSGKLPTIRTVDNKRLFVETEILEFANKRDIKKDRMFVK